MSSLRSPLPPFDAKRYDIPLAMPLTRSLRGCRQRRKELDARGRGGGRVCRCCRRGAQKVAKLRAAVLGLLGNSCGNELEKKCAACDAESISSKSESQPRKTGREKEEERQAASPERFLKITKLLSICSRGRNSNNNNGMSLTTINHGRLSGRVAAWVCLVGVHHRRLCACLARLIVLCLRLQRCFIFALNFASLTC